MILQNGRNLLRWKHTSSEKTRGGFYPREGWDPRSFLVSACHFGYSPCAQAHQDKDLIPKKHLLNPLFRFYIWCPLESGPLLWKVWASWTADSDSRDPYSQKKGKNWKDLTSWNSMQYVHLLIRKALFPGWRSRVNCLAPMPSDYARAWGRGLLVTKQGVAERK